MLCNGSRTTAPISSCLSANGAARSMAKSDRRRQVRSPTQQRSRVRAHSQPQAGVIGKVHAAGTWQDRCSCTQQPCSGALGTRLGCSVAAGFRVVLLPRRVFPQRRALRRSALRRLVHRRPPDAARISTRRGATSTLRAQASWFSIRSKCTEFWRPGLPTYAASDYQAVAASVFVGIRVGYRRRRLQLPSASTTTLQRSRDFEPYAHRPSDRRDRIIGRLAQQPLQVGYQRLDTLAVLDEQAHPTLAVEDVSAGGVIDRIRGGVLPATF